MSVSAIDIYARIVKTMGRSYGCFAQDSDYGSSVGVDSEMDDDEIRRFHKMWCDCSAVALWDRKDGTWSIHAQMPFPYHHYHGDDFVFAWEDAIKIASMISDHYEKDIYFPNREAQ
jgi:hypothetical protein